MNETLFPEYHYTEVGTYEPKPAPTGWRKIVRKPLTWLIVGLVILGGSLALAFAGAPGPVTPTSIVKGDGYGTVVTINHQDLVNAMNSGGGTAGLNPGDYFTTAAAGVNTGTGQEEVVIGLTDQGKGLDALLVPMFNAQSGVHAHTVNGGSDLVVSGSESALGGLANLGGNSTTVA